LVVVNSRCGGHEKGKVTKKGGRGRRSNCQFHVHESPEKSTQKGDQGLRRKRYALEGKWAWGLFFFGKTQRIRKKGGYLSEKKR